MDGEALAFRRLVHGFVRRFGLLDQAHTPCGMPLPVSQAHALMELLHSPGLTQQDLAERLGLSKSNISRLVARLVGDRRVQRERDGDDGRAYRLALTKKGRRLAEVLDARSLTRFRALYARLPARQRGSVTRALALLEKASRVES